jgi:hypothetical protein
LCTKSFNYEKLMLEEIRDKRDVDPDEVSRVDVMRGNLTIQDKRAKLSSKNRSGTSTTRPARAAMSARNSWGTRRAFEATTLARARREATGWLSLAG